MVSDPERGDPKWIVAFVVSGADVRPDESGTESPDELITRWAATRSGVARPVLAPMPGALAWRVDAKE